MENPPSPVREIAAKGTHEAVLALLRQEAGVHRVLDIPCGLGAFSIRLQQLGYDVTAADVVPGAAPVAARFRHANMDERLPFADGELDAVVCIDGIEHIHDPYGFAAECARVVRPGGVVILSTPNISSLRSRWRWFWTGFHHGRKTPLDERNVNPLHHINMIEFHKMRYMLHRVGFSITAIATNRIKPVAWLYAPLVPFAWLMTKFVFRHEIRGASQAELARQVLRQMFTRAVLFGDACIVKAVRLGPGTTAGVPPGPAATALAGAAARGR